MMSKTDKAVLKIIKSVVNKKYKNDVQLSSNLKTELEIDSLQMVTIASLLEEKVNFDILSRDDVDFSEIHTVQDVVNMVG